jgi:hypothetical protein
MARDASSLSGALLEDVTANASQRITTMMQDGFDFENFPHEPLQFPVTRRQLFASMRTNIEASSRKAEGGAVFELADLGCMTDSQLAGMTPQMIPGCQITIEEGVVFGQAAHMAHKKPLFLVDSPALLAFNLLNGQNSLAEIGRQVTDKQSWTRQRGFAYVRGLFLTLAQYGLCLPYC